MTVHELRSSASRAQAGKRVLITGGAGFVGSHLADELLAHGYRVRVLDNLCAQVHGMQAARPAYLAEDVELMVGDVCDPVAVRLALRDVDGVFHLAAAVGVGQSMYQIAHYTHTNNLGTAVLLEALVERPVQRLVVASSMSIYGEGAYVDADGTPVPVRERPLAQLRRAQWEPSVDGRPLQPVPTDERKPAEPSSVYALSKLDQERLCLIVGQAYAIPTTALRFFNIYGTRQALSNPYTGVLAIFAARLLNRKPPVIFEDGAQRRDFVHVSDVACACRLAYESEAAAGLALNIGSGQAISINEVAQRIAAAMGIDDLPPQLSGNYRVGDIRHCFADISLARERIGYVPRVELQQGLGELVAWLAEQTAADGIEAANAELARRGLQG
ncbi:dTDP-L-rhamnose 4-epimerase [Xanthomonas sacchari]|uniref:NAD-dependent epimerase/dehydratase family protein n=1 Tax=Xanthomonas sacchari TaxID=56458 RepID=A0AA46YAV0_9XANT|nr:NAD-dependent epimerase/dehydratase family protein [Xanthomonas sacchari]MCW0366090.1 dTDP-L-rhamnose 4-epimerase [Xanthomonas sacchari]MCW0440154.1 dTDP-L-rhamnose 4-epimerase [Xanthomonas sacchari]UYK90433.1 NAD-dependent epimerase/dehydratase family protein [Xanthomonas sacchari]